MKKLQYFIFALIILGGLFFLFGPEVVPDNFQPQEVLEAAKNSDVIIVFNSGGWGNTPLEEAEDFAPIVEGIQQTLTKWGYNSIVIPYNRTKDSFFGKVTGAKDFLTSFDSSSEVSAKTLEAITEKLPDKKIIIAGLSAGGTFVDETMEKISESAKDSVYAIAAGIPFWHNNFKSDNILLLDNNGKDTLSKGELKSLVLSLIKAPFKWLFSKINGQNLSFPQALRVPGHEYSWTSPEVSLQIVTFLKNKIR